MGLLGICFAPRAVPEYAINYSATFMFIIGGADKKFSMFYTHMNDKILRTIWQYYIYIFVLLYKEKKTKI